MILINGPGGVINLGFFNVFPSSSWCAHLGFAFFLLKLCVVFFRKLHSVAAAGCEIASLFVCYLGVGLLLNFRHRGGLLFSVRAVSQIQAFTFEDAVGALG